MKKITIVIFLLTYSLSFSFQDVMFVLPGKTSYVGSRTFNLFSTFYEGNTYWISHSEATKEKLSQYNNVVIISEEPTDYGGMSFKVEYFFGGSRGWSSFAGNNLNYRVKSFEVTMDLIEVIDPNFYEGLKEVFEDLSD